MKTEATGTVHHKGREVTANGKAIGHLVLHQGTGKYGEEYLAMKLLGKAVDRLADVEVGDVVRCSVDLKSNEAKNGTGRWYTDAVCFYVHVEEKGAGRRDENQDQTGEAADDGDVPF